MKLALLPASVACAFVLAGCGETEAARTATATLATIPTAPPASELDLTEKEAFTVGVAVTAVGSHCRRPEVVTEARLRTLVERLVVLARKKPDDLGSAFGEQARTPRGGLEDIAEELREKACAPAVEARVREVLRTL